MSQSWKNNPIIYPVASGKGGTGKSTIVSNIGASLAGKGYNVILVDCDFGGSDLHLFLDVPIKVPNLGHFVNGEITTFCDLPRPTSVKGLKIICGGSENIGMANISEISRNEIKNYLYELEADYVLIDLGAGTGKNTLDYFSFVKTGIVVCTPEPQSRVCTYSLLKNSVFKSFVEICLPDKNVTQILQNFIKGPGRRNGKVCDLIDNIRVKNSSISYEIIEYLKSFRPGIIANRVRKRSQIDDVNRFVKVVREFLSIELTNFGFIRSDRTVLEACQTGSLFVLDNEEAPASMDLRRIMDLRIK